MTNYYRARTRLAQMALDKLKNDETLYDMDRSHWYQWNLVDLPFSIAEKFLQLSEDDETSQFIEQSHSKSEYFFTQLFHSLVLTFFKIFMNTTSINGLLNRGSMFVFSIEQFKMLMGLSNHASKFDSLLDIGAGDGCVTMKMSPLFNKVYTTEMSQVMQWRLKQKGFEILDVYTWHSQIQNDETLLKFDMISCLNILDRCDKPYTLLRQIKDSLKPNGHLVLALVLPFRPFVEYNKDNKPSEQMPFQSGTSINEQIKVLIELVFLPMGFELVKWTRLPYLCEGNAYQSFYYLHDYVFILKNLQD